jgi:RNA polymerase sigma-70 factor, ECF subfamily
MEPTFQQYRRPLVARLVRKFGSDHVEAILDAVQEAFISAITSWPHHGEPENPFAWFAKVAERKVIDHLRTLARQEPILDLEIPATEDAVSEIGLYVFVCTPKLTIREQVCLALRTLTGLTAQEIARLMFESEEAVQRRISRSKDKLSVEDLSVRNPEDHLPAILKTIYLIFTEGYEAGRGEEYIRPELAYGALRLAEDLRQALPKPDGELDALLATLHFHCSRLLARVSDSGEKVFLDEMDSGAVSQSHLSAGFYFLDRAQSSNTLSRYHIEAGLAASIARGAPAEEIKHWHFLLATHFPSPMAHISYAIAVGKCDGAEAALLELETLTVEAQDEQYPYFAASKGYFLAQLGQTELARDWYRKALAGSMSGPARRGLERRYAEL